MPMMGHELATPRLQTEYSSHWAIQLKSYCWEGVEFGSKAIAEKELSLVQLFWTYQEKKGFIDRS